jgi:dihydrofolate synthase / folylpolyglutamate synthase
VSAEAYLDALAPAGIRLGLERVHTLLAALGRPERAFPAIHVVGTNGKSSTVAMAAAALQTTGRRVGAYLSPAVGGSAQAIRLDGQPVSDAQLDALLERVRQAAEAVQELHGEPPTRFEALTAAAFLGFREAAVDVAVVEAGLGGRLDATNVLAARTVGLTNVSLDHTDLLGDTAEEIAAQKLGVLTPGALLVAGELDDELFSFVAEQAHVLGALGVRRLDAAEIEAARDLAPGHAGAVNASLALLLARVFLGHEALDEDAAQAAVGAVRLPGRLQLVDGEPPLLLDGAHNPAGMRRLTAELDALLGPRRPRVAVLAAQRNKAVSELVSLLAPHVDELVATSSGADGALDAASVAAEAARAGLPVREAAPEAAIETAVARAGSGGAVLVTGSLYLLDRLAATGSAAGRR